MHGIEGYGEVPPQQIADLVEVEQTLHQRYVVVDAIDDLNLQVADAAVPWR